MSDHTPTPWHAPEQDDWRHHCAVVMSGTDDERIQVACCYDNHVKRDVAKANAAFIVRAVNAHDELVKAVKWLLNDLTGDEVSFGYRTSILNARAALKLATGKS